MNFILNFNYSNSIIGHRWSSAGLPTIITADWQSVSLPTRDHLTTYVHRTFAYPDSHTLYATGRRIFSLETHHNRLLRHHWTDMTVVHNNTILHVSQLHDIHWCAQMMMASFAFCSRLDDVLMHDTHCTIVYNRTPFRSKHSRHFNEEHCTGGSRCQTCQRW